MSRRVDVFIPNRSYARWLGQALRSVLDQQGVEVRVVVIDNASTDDSVALVEDLARRDSRVTLIRHERDQGLVASLNEGLDWCRAPHCVMISADDELTPGSLDRSLRLFERHPDLGFVYGPTVRQGPEPEPLSGRRYGPYPKVMAGEQWAMRCAATGKNPILSPEVMMRTALAQQVGYDERLRTCPDFSLWLGLAARAPVGHLRGSRQAVYRVHDGSLTHGQDWVSGLADLFGAFEQHSRDSHGNLSDPKDFLAIAARSVAREAVHVVELFRDWQRDEKVPVDDLLALAQRLWPEIVTTRQWRACERAGQRPTRSPVRLLHLVGHKAHSSVRELVRQERGW